MGSRAEGSLTMGGASAALGWRRSPRRLARAVPHHHALKQALLRIPSNEVTVPNVARCVDEHARSSYPGLSTHMDAVGLHTVVGLRYRADLAAPLLNWAQTRAMERGAGLAPSRLYTAALRGLAHHAEPAVWELAESIIERMHQDGVAPSVSTLQYYFRSARGSAHEPLQLLMGQLRQGAHVNRAAFDQLLAAQRRPHHSGESDTPQTNVVTLQRALQACGVVTSQRTVVEFLRIAQTPEAVRSLQPLLDKHRTPAVRDALTLALIRVDRPAAIRDVFSALQLDGALPTPHVLGELLVVSCRADDAPGALALLRLLWGRGGALNTRHAQRLLHTAGEAAGRGQTGARELLQELRLALFGDGPTARAQRGKARRSATAEHEMSRTLARALCRAGMVSPAAAQTQMLSRLAQVDVAPRRSSLATFAYLHASDGNFAAALELLRNVTPDRLNPPARMHRSSTIIRLKPSARMHRSSAVSPRRLATDR